MAMFRWLTMSDLILAIFVAAVIVLLSSCSVIDSARDVIADEAGARAVIFECGLSTDQRAKNVEAMHEELDARGSPARIVALDCDGDGSPDF